MATTLSRLALAFFAAASLNACAYFRIDPDHFLIRSDVIASVEQEKEILSRAKLGWTDDGKVRVLYVSGTPYERGYQQGVLLREEVRDNLLYLYDKLLEKYHFEELLFEAYERQRPYIPQDYIEEMHGLAHGSRLPLKVIHGIHALPEISEWGGKKKLKEVIKNMMNGAYGTSCSNFAASGPATADGSMYTVRILDWGLHKISKLHEYPLLTVNVPNKGIPSVNVGWIGFLGAVSGMNAEKITLGEMGYGDPDGETMQGEPMPFLLRDVLAHAKNLKDVRKIISSAPPTNAFVFLMSDGKNNTAELYIRDPFRFEVHKVGETLNDGSRNFPAISNIVYGGHYDEKMHQSLTDRLGKLTPQNIMDEVIPFIAMPSNFQNLLYDPSHLRLWFNNAKSRNESAASQPYTYFDLGKGLAEFKRREGK